MGVFFISMMIVVRIAFCELRERAEAGVLLFIVTKSLKQNTELPLHASEQDTSLVSRSIFKLTPDRVFFSIANNFFIDLIVPYFLLFT